MKIRPKLILLIIGLLAATGFAFETDQYHLPPSPLHDVGPEVAAYIVSHLQRSIDETNQKIELLEKCLSATQKPANCPESRAAGKQLAEMRDGGAVAEDLFRRVGDGNLFLTKFGRWFRGHKFNGSPDRFYVSYSDSIYFFKPSNQLTLSPTINVYGYKIGLDKLEHLLQQGWRYYTIRREAIDRGKPVADAERNAVDWGKRTERTYYGLMVSGVYSNGDLAANYAGMLFYRSIYKSISIDGESTKPIVRLDGGRWRIANDATNRILRPFITNHLNEALNPSMLAFNVYPTVARVVRDSACPQWRQRFDRDKATEFLSNSAAYRTWFGADYGHRSRGRSVSIDRCFNDQLPPNSTTTRSAS